MPESCNDPFITFSSLIQLHGMSNSSSSEACQTIRTAWRVTLEFLHLGTINILGQLILCQGAVLCTGGGLAASLDSTHLLLVPPLPRYDNQNCLQMLPVVPQGQNLPPVENHWVKPTRQTLRDSDLVGLGRGLGMCATPGKSASQPELRTTAQFILSGDDNTFLMLRSWQRSSFQLMESGVTEKYICRGKIEKRQLLLLLFLLLLSLRWETVTLDKNQIVKWQNRKRSTVIHETKK